MKRLTVFIPTLLAAFLLAWVQSLAQSAETPRNRLGAAEQAQTAVLYINCASVTPMGSAQPTATAIVLPTRGTSPTPTKLPPSWTPEHIATPLPATPSCSYAGIADKFQGRYTFTDPQGSGLAQNLRSGPGFNYAILGTLAKGQTQSVYWRIKSSPYDWLALDISCDRWLANLGTLIENP